MDGPAAHAAEKCEISQRLRMKRSKKWNGGDLWGIRHNLQLLPPKGCKGHELNRFCGAASLASYDENQTMPL